MLKIPHMGVGGREVGTLPLLTPPLSTVGLLTVGWLQKPEKVEKRKNHLKEKIIKKLCHLMPLLAIRPSTRSLHNLRKRDFLIFTDTETSGHCNSMSESAHWADSVKNGWSKIFYCHNLLWKMAIPYHTIQAIESAPPPEKYKDTVSSVCINEFILFK